MKKESTNVELEPITIVGGEVIADPSKEKTTIPPTGQLKIDSPEKEETVVINLGGEWPPKETSKEDKDEGR